jgi:exosortase N
MKTISLSLLYAASRLAGIFQQYKEKCLAGALVICYLLVFLKFLSTYFITDYTIWTALILSPYLILPRVEAAGSKKHLWLSLVFLILTLVTGIKTAYFLSIGFAILFVIESILGNIGHLPLFLTGLISPTFKYFNNMLGFPVRLTLSEWAGNILSLSGYKVEVVGNVIIKNGIEFAVDPACVGLKMMAFSILTGLFMMAYYEKFTKRQFSFLRCIIILAGIVLLNILSNLVRITLLTIFVILPDNPNHEITGILCFIVYVIAPSYFLIKWMAGRNKQPKAVVKRSIKERIVLNLLLFVAIATTGFIAIKQTNAQPLSVPQIDGYSKEIISGDVVKLEKTGILLYIKPLSKFYGAEHNPMICWTGSGYQFTRISTQVIAGKEIYTGVLKKNNDVIYAAWWFDNGKHKTISQTDWRWRAIKGENFYLVNVNSGNKETLDKEVRNLLAMKK